MRNRPCKEVRAMTVITISREAGSGGEQIARRVCELLGYRYFDQNMMAQVAKEQGLSDTEVIDFSEDNYRARSFIDGLLRRSSPVTTMTTVAVTTRGEEEKVTQVVDEETAAAFVAATIRALWKRGQVVVVGRGGQSILAGTPGVLHVRIVAPLEDRLERLMREEGLVRNAAQSLVQQRDRATADYLRRFRDVDWTDPTLYHLTVNSSLVGDEEAAALIADAARQLPPKR
jgi:CMP/dCMP kinase